LIAAIIRKSIMTIRKLVSTAIGVSALLVSSNASADYNANMVGVVVGVITYAEADQIYFQLNNQPATHPSCNPTLFANSADVTADRRKALLAQLMSAKAMGEAINIGYDNAGNCAHGYIRVHRIG
jgi:hypothetical protein